MTTSTLILPVTGEQDLASWAAVAFVASYSSPGTRQACCPWRRRNGYRLRAASSSRAKYLGRAGQVLVGEPVAE
jgi:hypothetical protein